MPSSEIEPTRDETTSAAPGVSPGPVDNDEIIVHEVYEPHHLVDGRAQVQCVPSDGLFIKGISFHRLKYVSREFIEKSRDSKLSRKPNWRFLGLAQLSVCKVRSFRRRINEVCIFLVVMDTASPENVSHASVYAVCNPSQYSKSIAREVRGFLLPLIERYTSIDSLFPSTDGEAGESGSQG